MSRRALPSIHPDDLRDHADEDRIVRIWERIEHDISIPEPAPHKGLGFAFALVAATVTAFAGGLFIGRVTGSDSSATPIHALAPEASAGFEVLAAGTAERTLVLPGGGRIKLSPGATVEVGRSDPNTLTIMLVQGTAAVDTTGATSDAALAIVAGQARLQSHAGSVVSVQRNASDIGVRVTSGLVSVTSPDGIQQQIAGGQPQITVPLRTSTAITMNDPVRPRVQMMRSSQPTEASPVVEPPAAVVAAAPDWRGRCHASDFAGALDILRQQPGGIASAIQSAQSAGELMCISDAAQTGGEQGAAIQALTRVTDKFPADNNAPIAAFQLARIYQAARNTELAEKYLALSRSLSPDGALAEVALCRQIRAEANKGRKEEASRMAREYVAKYPDGSCKEDVERIIQGEEPAPDEQEPEAPPDTKDAPAP
jgi:hypothetical protein